MIVRDVIAEVAKIAENDSLYQKIKNNTGNADEYVKDKIEVLLGCYKFVVRDVALNYYEFVKKMEVPVDSVALSGFVDPIIKIVAVTDKQGNKLQYKQDYDQITVESCPFVLHYKTIPNVQYVTENFVYEGTEIGVNVIIYGMLAEYMLMQNRVDEALNWESKYRLALDFKRDYKSRRIKAGKTWGL